MTNKNDAPITTRITRLQKEQLETLRKADKAGLSMAQYIRRLILDHITAKNEGK